MTAASPPTLAGHAARWPAVINPVGSISIQPGRAAGQEEKDVTSSRAQSPVSSGRPGGTAATDPHQEVPIAPAANATRSGHLGMGTMYQLHQASQKLRVPSGRAPGTGGLDADAAEPVPASRVPDAGTRVSRCTWVADLVDQGRTRAMTDGEIA